MYTIIPAEKISGVSAHTIRAWEKRYLALSPKRDKLGHRVYNKEEINRLILLKQLTQQGYAISTIANKGDNELRELLTSVDLKISTKEIFYSEEQKESEARHGIIILLMALKSYQLEIVTSQIDHLKQVLNPREFVFEVVRPIMSELGQAIENNEYTISQEHALSAILKFSLGQIIYFQKAIPSISSRKIAICSIEGDTHEFGILMAAMLASYYRIEFYYLGADLPAHALADAAKFLDVKMILIGATTMLNNLESKKIIEYFNSLQDDLSNDIEIYCGGELYTLQSKLQSKRLNYIKTIEDLDLYFSKL
jgi:DNA-binding transcriptional MerR regulator